MVIPFMHPRVSTLARRNLRPSRLLFWQRRRLCLRAGRPAGKLRTRSGPIHECREEREEEELGDASHFRPVMACGL